MTKVEVMVIVGGDASGNAVVLDEPVSFWAIRLGTAPAAFVLEEPDEILALGALVGEEIYGSATPIVIASPTPDVKTGDPVSIQGDQLSSG